MASLLDFPPLFVETLDKIRARLNADANAGSAPQDASFLDTTPGGFWYDLTQAPALEMERMWDSLNELAASMFLPFAWGIYLDLHGSTMALPRKGAVAATGVVTFTATAGTLIATGAQVATQQISADAEPIVFQTTAGATVPGSGTVDIPVEALTTGAESNVAAGTVSVLLSPVAGVSAISNSQPITGGSDIETDELYRARLLVAFAGAHGSGTIADYTEWSLQEPGVGFVTVEPLWAGGGTVRVIITDANNDAVSQTLISRLQTRLDPAVVTTALSGSVTFPSSTVGLISVAGLLASGTVVVGGTQVITYTGIAGTSLIGASGGAGSMPAGSTVIQSGRGHGLAPIGAVVTVATPTTVIVNVAATVSLAVGFSLDGTGGTSAVRADIQDAITGYLDSLRPGDSAVLQAVVARIMDVNGVVDVNAPTLNGVSANVIVSPLQVINSGTVTIS